MIALFVIILFVIMVFLCVKVAILHRVHKKEKVEAQLVEEAHEETMKARKENAECKKREMELREKEEQEKIEKELRKKNEFEKVTRKRIEQKKIEREEAREKLREINRKARLIKSKYSDGYDVWEKKQHEQYKYSLYAISPNAIVNSEKEIASLDKWAKIKQEKEEKENSLIEAVSSWNTMAGGLKYSYLFYYYPTTCNFQATQEEWYVRRLVWDFKNTPGKTSYGDHEYALDRLIPMIKKKLFSTFNDNDMKYLTLTCIPASSQVKTEARYKEFCDRLCKETGMVNAYSHIRVIKQRLEKHLGGTRVGVNDVLFDRSFFKGKFVLLFDDVVTRGDSMRTMKDKMVSLGAVVIGGLSLGITRHERPNSTIISSFPPTTMN